MQLLNSDTKHGRFSAVFCHKVRTIWAITWWWKSATRSVAGSVSRRQRCPPWGVSGIFERMIRPTGTRGRDWSTISSTSSISTTITWIFFSILEKEPKRSHFHRQIRKKPDFSAPFFLLVVFVDFAEIVGLVALYVTVFFIHNVLGSVFENA